MHILNTLILLATLRVAHAHPSTNLKNFLDKRAFGFEWTAWGDSYASGVGAGNYIEGRRCLKYDSAYPEEIQKDPAHLLPAQGGKFNDPVCSGAKAQEVIDEQFRTSDESFFTTDWQYYRRRSAGKPTVGTLTVGGDDVDFPGILNNCIMGDFPFPLSQGFTPRSCDDQRTLSWGLISQGGDKTTPNADLVSGIDAVIKKAVQWGQAASGNAFRLYVTGYGQFFNADDKGCDSVTFARTANPKPDGKKHTMMTTDLRADLNAMSRVLNAAVQAAVQGNADSNVKFIDIDQFLDGHRFCEPGITEPDQNNPNLYFFHYPYKENDGVGDPGIEYLNSVADDNANSITWDPSTTLWVDFMNEFWTKVPKDGLMQAVGAANDNDANFYNFWPDTIGYRAKVFHPQPPFHDAIYNAIIQQYIADGDLVAKATPGGATPTPAATPGIVPVGKPVPFTPGDDGTASPVGTS